MRLRTMAGVAAASVMLTAGVARANIIEDIYTGTDASYDSFKAVFEYNDQLGQRSYVPGGVDELSNNGGPQNDPTVFASLSIDGGPAMTLKGGSGDSEYYVIPGYLISSDFVAPNGDFMQFGVQTDSAPGTLATAFTDTGAQPYEGGYSIGGVSGSFIPYSVQVIVNPVSATPEPSTWVLMIAGVGLAGAALRRSARAGGELQAAAGAA